MIRSLALISLVLFSTAAPAQRVAPAERARLQRLGADLGRCHRTIVLRDARTRLGAAQIADRALAACAGREAGIRAALVRHLGPQRAQGAMQSQRQHWRQGIARMVAAARAR